MILYQAMIKNSRGITIQIYTGEVSDSGEIILDIPEDSDRGKLVIEWEVQDGNNSNDKPWIN